MAASVLYVCLGNSCRSIMAEALTRHIFPDSVNAGSAGISPLGIITEETLRILAEAGIATDGLRSKGLTDLDLSEFQLLVNLTHHSLEAEVPPIFQGKIIHRPVIDPYGKALLVYREARDNIRRFVAEELPRYFAQNSLP